MPKTILIIIAVSILYITLAIPAHAQVCRPSDQDKDTFKAHAYIVSVGQITDSEGNQKAFVRVIFDNADINDKTELPLRATVFGSSVEELPDSAAPSKYLTGTFMAVPHCASDDSKAVATFVDNKVYYLTNLQSVQDSEFLQIIWSNFMYYLRIILFVILSLFIALLSDALIFANKIKGLWRIILYAVIVSMSMSILLIISTLLTI